MHDRRTTAEAFVSSLSRWSLVISLLVGAAACNRRVNVVNPDAALHVGADFWHLLRINDVPKSVEMYATSVWSTDTGARTRWAKFLAALNEKFGVITATELKQKNWFPGSNLVADHRPFVCYSYDYVVTRQTLISQERLIACAEPGAPLSAMQVYGHRIIRPDTAQAVTLGIDFEEKSSDQGVR